MQITLANPKFAIEIPFKIKENYPDCVGIFIMPPKKSDLLERLKKRGTETMDVIKQRIKTAENEMNEKDIYDYVIVNEDGKSVEAMEKIYDIINE